MTTRFSRLLLIPTIAILLAHLALAQVTQITDATAPPVQGSGHNYIGMLNESVNPTTGALTIHIDLPVAPGRKLTIPFAVEYNSGRAWFLARKAGYAQQCLDHSGRFCPHPQGYAANSAADGNLTRGGWSSSFPEVSFSLSNQYPYGSGPGYPCQVYSAFMFKDTAGSDHQLNLSHLNPTYAGVCTGEVPTLVEADSVSETNYQATLPFTNGQPNGGTGFPRVAGPDGAIYVFGSIEKTGDNNVQYWLPTYVEDSNGNIANVGSAPGNFLVVTDTLGRSEVTLSSFGSGTSTISVGGLGYSLTWQTITPTGQTITSTNRSSSTHCQALPATAFANDGAGNASVSVIKQLNLPNGQSYKFDYDGATGLLKQITYPSGGTVTYGWGTYLDASSIAYNDVDGNLGSCAYTYSTPAITSRTVKFDGSTTALSQTFTYSTSWNIGNSGANTQVTGGWTAKNTTVLSTTSGRTSKTIYNHDWVFGAWPISYLADQTTIGLFNQFSVEGTVNYYGYADDTPSYPLLKTVNKGWFRADGLPQGVPLLGCQFETLDNGLVTGAFYAYSAGGQRAHTWEYDYGQLSSPASSFCYSNSVPGPTPPGSPTAARETVTTYQTFAATPIFPSIPSIFNRPASVKTYDYGTLEAETDYSYDGAPISPISGVTGLPAGSHDETNYAGGSTAARGNATTKTQKCFPLAPETQTCSDAVTTFAFDSTGQVLKMVDPDGNVSGGTPSAHMTTYSYTDNYLPGSGAPGGVNTNAYLTTITRPTVGSVTTHGYFQYDFSDGQLTKSQDDNDVAAGKSTIYSYADSFRRPTEADLPDGGYVKLSYSDILISPSVTKKVLVDGTGSPSVELVTTTTMDGMGHAVKTQLTSDPDGTTTTDTTYDGLNRVKTKSNPYRTTSDPTYGLTTNSYDALGRIKTVSQPDNSSITTTYSGNCTTVVDETGKSRTSCTNGLGKLTKVNEAPTTLNYETDYQYDALGNLRCAVQKATDTSAFTSCSAAPATWRPRSFLYNSLSRITSATNPESGTISYSYDANGNLLQKTSPKPNQGNPATKGTVNYCYDALNRMTSKAYNTTVCPPSSPVATYGYDQGANGIGRRTSMSDSPGSSTWTYDIMGRIASETRITASVTKTTSYLYNQDGSIKSVTYPSTRTVNYTYGPSGSSSTAARPVSAVDAGGPTNYVTGATYAPFGGISGMFNGIVAGGFGGVVTTNWYNQRLQPCRFSARTTGSAPTNCTDSGNIGGVLDLRYDFHAGSGDNGNVYRIINNRDTNRTQNFLYDDLNRIQQAYTDGSNWGETISPTATNPGVAPSTSGIDAWGNLTNRSGVVGKNNYEPLNCAAASNNNQLTTCLGYDAAGNMTSYGTVAYTYNQEDQMTKYTGAVTDIYVYDGDGQRVKKNASSVTLYWYDTSGNVLEETTSTGNLIADYVFFNGKRVARRDADTTVKYYFSDHLGSASVITDPVGTMNPHPLAESDYYPYGGEIVIWSNDSNHYKFTGKERDAETCTPTTTCLDNFDARYYGSALGRFMTPDWAARAVTVPYATFGDPQTLNLYTYVENAPLNRIDADGHGTPCTPGSSLNGEGQKCVQESQVNQENAANAAQNTVDRSGPAPPPPPTPGVPPQVYDDAHVNNMTVRQVANVVANENRDVTPGTSTPQALQEAKTAQANAVMNADYQYGGNRQNVAPTAPATVTNQLANSPQYQQALQAARTAFVQQNLGTDPTGNRVFFNNRWNNSTAPRTIGNQQQTVFKQYGPFSVGGGNVWTLIYNNP